MQAVIYTEYGPPDVLHLTEREQPTPKDNEVLIKVQASSVTSGDCNARNFVFVPDGLGLLARLMMGVQGPKKSVLGIEVAGDVVAVGSAVTQFKVGDAVFGIDGDNFGAYAEYKTMAQAAGLVHKPDSLSYQEAAALPNGALTAYTFLKTRGKLQAGQRVLVNGASGSVGSAGVQIAKHFGAEVTGVCSTQNVELVRSLGADHVIDYTQADFTDNGQSYDLILDTVGNTSFAACKASLTPEGRYLAVAGGARELVQSLLPLGKQKVVAGPSSESQADLLAIQQIVEAGDLKPVLDRCYPLGDIVEAHRYVDTGRKRGNVVITLGD